MIIMITIMMISFTIIILVVCLTNEKLRAIFVTETIANRLSFFSSKSESEGSVNESIQKITIK